MKRAGLFAVGLTLAVTVGAVIAQEKAEKKPVKPPEVTGSWTGTWGLYFPPEVKNPPKLPALGLDAKVDEKDGKWEAEFEGEAGKPYKYKIKMEGRQAGGAVLFKGTTDLGEKDGGVFDWIGRATDKEFQGFFTGEKYTGTFRLKRK